MCVCGEKKYLPMRILEIPFKSQSRPELGPVVIRYRLHRFYRQSNKDSEADCSDGSDCEVDRHASVAVDVVEERIPVYPIIEKRILQTESMSHILSQKDMHKIQWSLESSSSPKSLRIRGPRPLVDMFKSAFDRLIAKSIPFTHYIAMRLEGHRELMNSLKSFCEEMDPALPVIKTNKLHITFLMLRLLSVEQVHKARQVMERLRPVIEDILRSRGDGVVATVTGVDVMKGSLSKANVLHACVFPTDDRLNRIAQLFIDNFLEERLCFDFEAELPMFHITLINSKYHQAAVGYKAFDATAIFADYNSYEFGTLHQMAQFELLERKNVLSK